MMPPEGRRPRHLELVPPDEAAPGRDGPLATVHRAEDDEMWKDGSDLLEQRRWQDRGPEIAHMAGEEFIKSLPLFEGETSLQTPLHPPAGLAAPLGGERGPQLLAPRRQLQGERGVAPPPAE